MSGGGISKSVRSSGPWTRLGRTDAGHELGYSVQLDLRQSDSSSGLSCSVGGERTLLRSSGCSFSYFSLMAWNGITHLSVTRSPSASPSGMLQEVGLWEYLLRSASASDPTGFAASHDRSNTLWRWGKPLPGSLGKDIWHG
jgi:hypothetical protein